MIELDVKCRYVCRVFKRFIGIRTQGSKSPPNDSMGNFIDTVNTEASGYKAIRCRIRLAL